jgi:ATP-dependent RNA helicase DOB1
MGLNMPARTVLFTSARKFDGKDFRWVINYLYFLFKKSFEDTKGVIRIRKLKDTTQRSKEKGQKDKQRSTKHYT